MEDLNVDNRYTDPKTGKFVKGNPGGGRPEGSISAIAFLKKKYRENPEKFDEFIERYSSNPANDKHQVEMLDGKPRQNVGLEVEGGLSISFAPVFEKDDAEESA